MVVFHPANATYSQKLWKNVVEFAMFNEEIGYVYVPGSYWRIFSSIGLPVFGFLAAQFLGKPEDLVKYYVLALLVGQLLNIFVVKTTPPSFLESSSDSKTVTLKCIKKISPDTWLMKFDHGSNFSLGLTTMEHISFNVPLADCPKGTVEGEWNGEEDPKVETLSRKYTPIAMDVEAGEAEYVVKAYQPCERFPDGGRVGRYLVDMKVGDKLNVSGPVGVFQYLRGGAFHDKIAKKYYTGISELGMVAGGSGITPMIFLIRGILEDSCAYQNINMSLIFCNKSIDDILCKDILDKIVEEYPNRLKIHYVVDALTLEEEKAGWQGSTGYVTKKMIEDHMPGPDVDTLIFQCGPKPMKDSVDKICDEMKYPNVWPVKR